MHVVKAEGIKSYGDYKTQKIIFEIYDKMVEAIIAADSDPRSPAQETRLGNCGYTTCLNPLHGHPDVPTPGMQRTWAQNPRTNGGKILMTRQQGDK